MHGHRKIAPAAPWARITSLVMSVRHPSATGAVVDIQLSGNGCLPSVPCLISYKRVAVVSDDTYQICNRSQATSLMAMLMRVLIASIFLNVISLMDPKNVNLANEFTKVSRASDMSLRLLYGTDQVESLVFIIAFLPAKTIDAMAVPWKLPVG
jgi:hypothetical protein